MNLFDSHSHLNDEKFDNDREEVIKEICESGVTNFITAGYSVESSKKALEIANKYTQLQVFLQTIFHKQRKSCGNNWQKLSKYQKKIAKKYVQ